MYEHPSNQSTWCLQMTSHFNPRIATKIRNKWNRLHLTSICLCFAQNLLLQHLWICNSKVKESWKPRSDTHRDVDSTEHVSSPPDINKCNIWDYHCPCPSNRTTQNSATRLQNIKHQIAWTHLPHDLSMIAASVLLHNYKRTEKGKSSILNNNSYYGSRRRKETTV